MSWKGNKFEFYFCAASNLCSSSVSSLIHVFAFSSCLSDLYSAVIFPNKSEFFVNLFQWIFY